MNHNENQHLQPLKTFLVIDANGKQRQIQAHAVEFAGEMNSCLWFYKHISEYETEIVYAFQANAWRECYPDQN